MKVFPAILVIMIIVGILPSLILAALSLSGVERLVRDASHEALAAVTKQATDGVSRRVEAAYRTVQLLAENPVVATPDIPRDVREFQLTSAMSLNPDFRDISLLDRSGRTIASVNYAFIGDWKSTSWFLTALGGSSVISDAHAVLAPYDVVYTVALGVTGPDEETAAVLVSQVSTREISAILRSAELGFNGEFYVVNESGIVMAAGSGEALEPISVQDLLQPSPAQDGPVTLVTRDGEEFVAVVLPIEQSGASQKAEWQVVGIQPTAAAYAPVYGWRRAMRYAFGGAIVVVVLLSIMVARFFTGRSRRVADAARRIGHGEFSVRITPSVIREINDLGAAINTTAQQLSDAHQASVIAQAELAAARDELEQRVEERTAELQREIEIRRTAEEHAVTAMKTAEGASKAKTDFLANMSHELRTPLNHIIGFMQLVADPRVGPLADLQREYLEDALGSSQHLLSLINEVLDLAKVESGKMSVRTSQFDPRVMLESCVRSVEGQATLKSIAVGLETEALPLQIVADEQKLIQVMYNLLSNALKFTDSGGKIEVRSWVVPATESDPQELHFSVSDSGIGVRPEDAHRIFRPFEQVTSDQQNAIAGTGLGLALSQRLVELHGGSIRVQSDGPGQGSTFSFFIPISVRSVIS